MKYKRLLLLLLSSISLTSCTITFNVNELVNEINKDSENNNNNNQTNNDGEGGNENNPPQPSNNKESLSDYTNYSFHEGHYPAYNSKWNFYYGDSHNPYGCLWTNPNEDVNYSGVEFKKNCYIVSPKFESWKKLEIRFDFWFTLHTSNNYNATKNEPQFKLEMYNDSSSLLETINIDIAKSDVPTNNTVRTIKKYVYQDTASWFILRWNNYVPNSSGGYGQILCDATLKGWPYSN